MNTLEEIRVANPNFGKNATPIFRNSDDLAETKNLGDRAAFRETFNDFADLLLGDSKQPAEQS
jgi:hypothetical protein